MRITRRGQLKDGQEYVAWRIEWREGGKDDPPDQFTTKVAAQGAFSEPEVIGGFFDGVESCHP